MRVIVIVLALKRYLGVSKMFMSLEGDCRLLCFSRSFFFFDPSFFYLLPPPKEVDYFKKTDIETLKNTLKIGYVVLFAISFVAKHSFVAQ